MQYLKCCIMFETSVPVYGPCVTHRQTKAYLKLVDDFQKRGSSCVLVIDNLKIKEVLTNTKRGGCNRDDIGLGLFLVGQVCGVVVALDCKRKRQSVNELCALQPPFDALASDDLASDDLSTTSPGS